MMRRSNNRGFSLVELIVVIAIMVIMIGFVSLSASMIFGTQAKECAQKVGARMDATKTGSMSRYNEVMVLRILSKDVDGATRDEIKSDGIYADNFITTIKKSGKSVAEKPIDDPEARRMGNAKVVVTAYLSDGSSYVLKDAHETLGSGECGAIVIRYQRTTGAFDCVGLSWGGTQDRIDGVYLEKLTFQSGMRTYVITFVKETGTYVMSRL